MRVRNKKKETRREYVLVILERVLENNTINTNSGRSLEERGRKKEEEKEKEGNLNGAFSDVKVSRKVEWEPGIHKCFT